jgi:phosphatidylglycerophosphate synthase
VTAHPPDRRPLRSRETAWARALTRRLARAGAAPNAISGASVVAAAVAGAALWGAGATDGVPRVALLVLAALGCQARLLCNLLDGLVAVEAGPGAPDGAFWNEAPDRVSDMLILAGLGLGAGAPALGWAAASLAVLTAYVRELGRGLGQSMDYRGPMAKPQRMAVVTGAALLAVLDPLWGGSALLVGLSVVVAGAALTTGLRAGSHRPGAAGVRARRARDAHACGQGGLPSDEARSGMRSSTRD